MNTLDPQSRCAVKCNAFLHSRSPYSPGVDAHPIDLRLDRNERIIERDAFADLLSEAQGPAVAAYPDKSHLEALLASRLGVEAERVIVTGGGDDAIDRCCRAVLNPQAEILLHTPTFEMIERSAAITGARVRSVEWMDGAFPVESFLDAITPATRLIALVTPNNPTGLAIETAAIARIAAAATEALVLIDAAYVEFADEDLTGVALKLPNVVIVRTFSKAYALAGMRLGYAVGEARIINWLRCVGGPYPTSGVGLEVAHRLLSRGAPGLGEYIARVRIERDSLRDRFTAAGWKSWSSQANFVLVRHGSADALRTGLAQRGIAVRGFATSPILRDCLRITCPGHAASFERLNAALAELL